MAGVSGEAPSEIIRRLKARLAELEKRMSADVAERDRLAAELAAAEQAS